MASVFFPPAGSVFTVLTATSDVKTPGGSAQYHQLANNSVTLTPGTWRLWCSANFNNAGSVVYTAVGLGLAGSNGANSATQPTSLAATTNLTLLSVQKVDLTTYVAPGSGGTGYVSGDQAIVRASATVTVYVVTWSEQTTSGNARVTAYLNAERIL